MTKTLTQVIFGTVIPTCQKIHIGGWSLFCQLTIQRRSSVLQEYQ